MTLAAVVEGTPGSEVTGRRLGGGRRAADAGAAAVGWLLALGHGSCGSGGGGARGVGAGATLHGQ